MKLKAVKQVDVYQNMLVNDLVREMSKAGVMGAGKIAEAADILERMIKDKDCKVFFGLAGAMVPGGMRNIIIDMIETGYIDVLVTTGANLTHDLVEAIGHKHYQGNPKADDIKLNKMGINRMYDSYMNDEVYASIEDFIIQIKNTFLKRNLNTREFLFHLGSKVKAKSILSSCYKKNIPIFCPALSDSGLGQMIFTTLIQNNILDINAFSDLLEIQDLSWKTKRAGIFYIGGGVPKNYIQQAMQFSKGASYGIQITTDRQEFGGSSGALLREGISWGKLKHSARFADVICDATIALPLIYAAVKDRVKQENL